MNYYETLGVAQNATEEEIKKAYKKLAFEFHPDRNSNPDAEIKFKQINEANQILSDPQKRQMYDFQTAGGGGGNGFPFPDDIGDFFRRQGNGGPSMEDLFNHFGGFARVRQAIKINAYVKLTLKEVLKGKEEEMELELDFDCGGCNGTGAEIDEKGRVVEHNVTKCSNCDGNGRINVRQGMFNATMFCKICSGKGKRGTSICKTCSGNKVIKKKTPVKVIIPAGVQGGNMEINVANGKHRARAIINIEAMGNQRYEMRPNGDLFGSLPVSYAQACLGHVFPITLADDSKVNIRVPAGTSPGKVIKIPGKGLPREVGNTANLGDLLLLVDMKIPTNLNEKQKDALKNFESLLEQAPTS